MIYLLTHEREINRPTNTGKIALENTPDYVKQITWERVNPNFEIVDLINQNRLITLYPDSNAEYQPINIFENTLIIDATWDEARKMYNHSPYLKKAPKGILKPTNQSKYNLRVNQPPDGLCTIECIIEILKLKREHEIADELEELFNKFNH